MIKPKQFYICSHCRNTVSITNTNIERLSYDYTGTDVTHTTIEPMSIDYWVRCNKCNDMMFECDEKMVPYIVALMKRGYETLWCCEGHHRDLGDPTIMPNEEYIIPYLSLYIPSNIFESNKDSILLQEYEDDLDWLYDNDPIAAKVRFTVYGMKTSETENSMSGEEFSKHKDRFFSYLEILLFKALPDIHRYGDGD